MTHDERLKFYQRKYLAATDEKQKDRILELFRKECKEIVEERHMYDVLKYKMGITETFGM